MDAAWYWCDVIDRFELADMEQPEWNNVPAEKRDTVRERWARAQEERLAPARCKMWGPQIPWYQRQAQYSVTVIEKVRVSA